MSSARTTRAPSSATFLRSPSPDDEAEELAALELERLVGGDLRDVDVAGARLPLAVRVDRLPGRLLVDRDLAVELHVVEDGHLLGADDGHLPHLVRIEPREVHVRDLPRGKAQVAEDDVLDAGLQEVLTECDRLCRILVEEIEDDREVVDAERPQCVLVLAG